MFIGCATSKKKSHKRKNQTVHKNIKQTNELASTKEVVEESIPLEKKEIRIKKHIPFIMTFLLCVLVGGIIGVIAGKTIGNANGGSDLPMLVISGLMLLGIVISYGIHITMHEVGHMLFGLMTGYHFLSFRIGNVVVSKEEGKLKWKRLSLPGTGGQAIMYPPQKKEGKYPFVLYNLGGILMNFVLSTIGLILYFVIRPSNEIVALFLVLMAVIGYLVVIVNGNPILPMSIQNDGKNVLSMMKDSSAREAFYSQLSIYGMLCEGKEWKDIPASVFYLGTNVDFENSLCQVVYLNKMSYFYNKMEFDKARNVMGTLATYRDKMSVVVKLLFDLERMFLEAIGEGREEVLDEYYSLIIENGKHQMDYMLAAKRCLYAYYALGKKEQENADKVYEEAMALADKTPVAGDVANEKMLLQYVHEKMIEL